MITRRDGEQVTTVIDPWRHAQGVVTALALVLVPLACALWFRLTTEVIPDLRSLGAEMSPLAGLLPSTAVGIFVQLSALAAIAFVGLRYRGWRAVLAASVLLAGVVASTLMATFTTLGVFGFACCVEQGTLVTTAEGPVAAETLHVGDHVPGPLLGGSIGDGVITRVQPRVVLRHVELRLDNGRMLRASRGHRVITDIDRQERWQPVETLGVGQRVRCDDGWAEVMSVEEGRGTLTVIELKVSGTETFFADGISCHNKKG